MGFRGSRPRGASESMNSGGANKLKSDFLIDGKGTIGYLKNLPRLKEVIRNNDYSLIHAHYGLSGLLATLQRKKKVVVTFHGTDINSPKNIIYSRNKNNKDKKR